ncbi:MAG: protein-export chaperone SecB [Alphaproteobacteria bacterium]|nr:protein-export chaperone SecB [Alphaproteobacteria bacterium]
MTSDQNVEPVFTIVAQYTKDLSFENITPVSTAEIPNEQPNIDVQLKVNHEKGKTPNLNVVSLTTEITAKIQDKTLFVLELIYIGEFIIKGFEEKLMDPLLYVECPRMLFPFARSIIASTVSEGGFPPLYLAPVNFAELYQQQLEAKNHTQQ